MTRCDEDIAHDREERKDGRQVTRFLIVEDHPLFREALESAVCLANPDAEILQATSIDGAIEVLSSTDRRTWCFSICRCPAPPGYRA